MFIKAERNINKNAIGNFEQLVEYAFDKILWDSSSSSIFNVLILQQGKKNHRCIPKLFFKILRKSVFEETQNLRKHFPIILNSMLECKTMIYFFYIKNLKRNFSVFKCKISFFTNISFQLLSQLYFSLNVSALVKNYFFKSVESLV